MRNSLLASLAVGAAFVGVAGGCASILGFEDTALRPFGPEGRQGVDGAPGSDVVVPGDGDAPPDGAVSRVFLTPSALTIRRGATTTVVVDFQRGADAPGAVTARLANLPSGVTATAGVFLDGVASATLTLTASPNAVLGAGSAELTLEGVALAPTVLPLLVSDPPGALDLTFGTDGHVQEAALGLGATFLATRVLADGSIVAAGAGASTTPGWLLRRYSSGGVPDAAWNALESLAGSVPLDGEARAVATSPEGDLLVVGWSQSIPQLTLVKVKAAGGLDGSFAGGGIVRPLAVEAPLGSVGYAVAVQPDGTIVVAGAKKEVGNSESGIVFRLLPNGARDPSFNGGTTAVTPTSRFVGLVADGATIVAAGSSSAAPLPSYLLVRRGPGGASDPTFGTGGTATFGNSYRANAFAPAQGGAYFLVGDVLQGSAAYTAGLADAVGASLWARGFGNAPGAAFFGAAVTADGRLVAVGHVTPNGEARVQRMMPDGTPDMSFGAGSISTIDVAGGPDVTLFAAAIQADGRILAAGPRSVGGAAIYRLWP